MEPDPKILVAYRHGFRASEVGDLEWSAIDFARAAMHVTRKKSGKPSTHPIRGGELRELRKLRRGSTGPFVFMSERGGPFTTDSFNWTGQRAGAKAKLPFQVQRPHVRNGSEAKNQPKFFNDFSRACARVRPKRVYERA